MKTCANGYSRFVFLIGSYAIKVPYLRYSWYGFVRGLYMNLREVCVYRFVARTHPDRLYLLCPVVCSFLGFVVVMRRAETGLTERDIGNHWELIEANNLGGDDKVENYGRIDGRLVKLDYADCKRVFD